MKEELLPWKQLKRQRIYDCLTEGINQPLCIVQASEGIGKKSAVKGFLEELGIPYFWYLLKDDEHGNQRIWRQIKQYMGVESEERRKEFLGGYFPQNAKERQAFINRLRQKVEEETIVVLEDRYQSGPSIEFNALLEDIVKAEVENLHLILICNRMPEICGGSVIPNSTYNIVSENVLNFTESEIGDYFKINGIELSTKEQWAIYQYTEGWAKAICLVLQDYLRIGKLRGYVSAWNYMKEQVFDGLSEVEQEIVMRLSPLKTFTIGEAIFVTRMPECRAELKKAALETNFLEYNMEDGTFRMHHLLKLIAEKEYSERGNSVQEICKRSAMWKEEHGDPVSAIHSYLRIGETEEAFRVLEKGNALEIYTEAPDIFADMCASLEPREKIDHLKAYLTYLYYLEAYDDSQAARRDLKKTWAWFQANGLDKLPENRRIVGEMCIMHSIMNIDRIGKMAETIREAYELLDGEPSEIFDNQFIAFYMVPELYGLHYNQQGKLPLCIEQIQEFSKYYFHLINAKDCGWEWMAKAEYYYLLGDVQKAFEISKIAFQKACFRKESAAIISTGFLKMKCCIYLGEYTALVETLKIIEEAGKNTENKEAVIVLYDLVNGYIRQCLREIGIAEWVKNYEVMPYNNYFKTICAGSITYADILVYEGRYAELTAVAEDMIKYQERSSRCYLRIMGGIYMTIAEYHLFGGEVAKQELEKVLKIAQQDEVIAFFMETAEELLPILRLVQDEEIDREYLKKVIFHCQCYQAGLNKIRNKEDDSENAGLLTERELEILQLVKSGYKNAEIGENLHIATVTVEKTLSNIYRKLNVKGRAEAVRKLDKIL